MSDKEIMQKMENLSNAINRLGDALNQTPVDEFIIDATIQRFEFTFELFWKTLKYFLEHEGVEVGTPRKVLKKSYAAKWIDNDGIWLSMLDDRNRTSHVYDESLARQIYLHIHDYLPEMQQVYSLLQREFINNEKE